MVVGYLRLSRDDDKKNYVSIENQKLIIEQYALQHNIVVERWYIDDGVSGYSFNRPGFRQLMEDMENEVDTVIAKDLSRIGRHNAKVLLLLDEFKERGKRLVIIDDDYDTFDDEDDIIGIKTWYNERYVKDTSKKIRKVMRARQKEGTLMTALPFGYIRNPDKSISPVENEAKHVRRIFELYLQGNGYRKIAMIVTEEGMPTPSMILHERTLKEGKTSKRNVTVRWTDGMVSDILKNDFYIGNLRLHKRARTNINGSDRRVTKDEQILFPNNHEAIIPEQTFNLVQEIMKKRIRTNYRGQSSQGNIFGGCLFCKDCGSRLTPILRKRNTTRKYYLCNTYNSKGKGFCEYSHLITENSLIHDVITYIKLCRNALTEMIQTYDLEEIKVEKESVEDKRRVIAEQIKINKKQLKLLIGQKVKEISNNTSNADLINETYASLQEDIMARICGFEKQLNERKEIDTNSSNIEAKLKAALNVVDGMIDKGSIDHKDVEILVEKIVVDRNGMAEIELKYGLNKFVHHSPIDELNRYENEVILETMKIILKEERGYTSAKHISEELIKAGYPKYKKATLPYIKIMIEKGILKATENKIKPYDIIVSEEELSCMIKVFIESMSDWRNAPDGLRICVKKE